MSCRWRPCRSSCAGRGSGDRIEIGPYLTRLCDSLAKSMIGADRTVPVVVKAGPGTAASGQAVSIGLIVTELLINAVKHAFPDARSGRIEVRLRGLPDQNGGCRSATMALGVAARAANSHRPAWARALSRRSPINSMRASISPPGAKARSCRSSTAPANREAGVERGNNRTSGRGYVAGGRGGTTAAGS